MSNVDKISVDKTLRPSDEKVPSVQDKTLAGKAPKVDKTLHPKTDETLHPSKQQEINKIVNPQETEFILNGVKYQVVKPISGGTGEAQVYLLEKNSIQFALKLYYSHTPPNREIIEIVKQSAASGLLVGTLEYGVWTNPLTNETRDYELMVFCEGGSLDQVEINHDENKLAEIALKAAVLLDYLHKQQVIHRDVKPANFFFLNSSQDIDNMVLGDFGIAVKCKKNGKAIVDSQLRTKTYAAPEFYHSIDQKIEIYTKSDFYSLGISLLTLWDGEGIFAIPEWDLSKMKIMGKLPYPKDMSGRMLQLVKALTTVDPNARAGFPEVVRWAKGETIFDIKSEDDIRGFRILFNAAKKQVAHSPEELVQFMYEDKDLAIKYLYSEKITKWLTENLRPELAINIESIVETQYQKDKEAGFMAACYMLNPQLPYTDVAGNILTSSEEIAMSLRNNSEHYENALSNKNDSLFIFFNLHGFVHITNKFAPLFKKDNDNHRALMQLIFALNPAMPFTITTDDGTIIECQTPEDVINAKYEHMFSDKSWEDLIDECFFTWLSNRDMALAGKIRSQDGHDRNPWCVLYFLSLKTAYTFQLDENAGDYFFTHTEVAQYMNNKMNDYINEEKGSAYYDFASDQLDMMCSIDQTRLYYYLKSKGVYDDKIEWIKYCADIESKDNVNKAGPYNWRIGIYKAIKGLGYTPYYYFPKSNIHIFHPDDLNRIPDDEILEEFEKVYLDCWMTVFYQEDPDLDLSEKYEYESMTADYVLHLEMLDENNGDVANYRIATGIVDGNQRRVKRNHRFHLLSKIIFGSLTLMTVAVTIFYLISLKIPPDFVSKDWNFVIAMFVGTIVTFWRWFGFDNLFVALLIGAGAFFAASIVLLGLSYFNYVVAGFLFVAVIWVVILCYLNYPVATRNNRDLFNPGFEELYLEPLHFTYIANVGEHFKSSIGDRSWDYVYYLKKGTKKLYIWLGSLFLLSLLIAVITIYYITPKIERNLAIKAEYESIIGEWKGKFDNSDATFTINSSTPEAVNATIEVQFKKPADEKLSGKLNHDEKTITFKGIEDKSALDGEFSGAFNEDMTIFEGVHNNMGTKKQSKFKFTKNELSELQQAQ